MQPLGIGTSGNLGGDVVGGWVVIEVVVVGAPCGVSIVAAHGVDGAVAHHGQQPGGGGALLRRVGVPAAPDRDEGFRTVSSELALPAAGAV